MKTHQSIIIGAKCLASQKSEQCIVLKE